MRFKRYPKIKPKDSAMLAMQAKIDDSQAALRTLTNLTGETPAEQEAKTNALLAEHDAQYTKYEQYVGRLYSAELRADEEVERANKTIKAIVVDENYVAKPGEKEKIESKIKDLEDTIVNNQDYIDRLAQKGMSFYVASEDTYKAMDVRISIAALKRDLAKVLIEYHRKFSRKAVAAQLKVQLAKIADKLKK